MFDIDDIKYSTSLMQIKQFKFVFWIIIIIILITLALVISTFFKYYKYVEVLGYVVEVEENYFLKTYVLEDDLRVFIKSKLFVNEKEENFKIIEINNEYFVDDKLNRLYEVVLDLEIEESLKISNMVVTLKYEHEKTTLVSEIIKFLKKGMM